MKKSKHGDYERVVTFPVWSNYKVHVIFTDNIAESRIARYGDSGLAEGANALHCCAKDGHSHLLFKLGDCTIGVVAHECWHAIRCMLVDWAGVEIMENELTAYHLGYLVDKVSEFRNDLIDVGIGKPSKKS
jgi:hypothetical protein